MASHPGPALCFRTMSDRSRSSEESDSAPEASEQRVGDLTVRDLLALLRAEMEADPASSRESAPASAVRREVAASDEKAVAERGELRAALDAVGPSPTDVQVCFLRGLVDDPAEAKKFLDSPKTYAKEHGVLLDPQLVRDIVDTVVFGDQINERLAHKLSPGALRDVAHLRSRPNACVMGGASTVVSDVVSLVVTAASSPSDLVDLKGLGKEGVRLPGGRVLRVPKDLNTVLTAASNAVAVYGATATGGALVMADSGRSRGRLSPGRESGGGGGGKKG